MTLQGILMAAAGGSAPVATTYLSNSVSGSNLTTYTFSSVSLGTADKIVVGALGHSGNTGRTLSSVSVGGSGTTSLVQQTYEAGAQTIIASLWIVDRPASSGDIVLTFSGGMTSAGIIVYGVDNASSTANDTAVSTATPLTDTIDCEAGGAIIGVAAFSKVSTTTTWTGITEDVDTVMETNEFITGAHDDFETAQSALTITATPSTTPDRKALAAVALSSA